MIYLQCGGFLWDFYFYGISMGFLWDSIYFCEISVGFLVGFLWDLPFPWD